MHRTHEYRPIAQGEIGTIEWVFDVRTTGSTYPATPDTYAILFFPLLMQNDAYYVPATGPVGGETWGTYISGQLIADQFARFAGDPLAPSFPDFSGNE